MIRTFILAAAAATAAWVALTGNVSAQAVPCGPIKPLEQGLLEKYGERLVGMGLSSGNIFRLYASPNGSWTFAFVKPTHPKMLCIAAAGESWQVIEKPGKEI